MKIMITNLARLCSVIFIAAMVTTPALATPIDTYKYDIYNITDLSSTSNTFTIDASYDTITAVNLGFTSLDNLSFTSILFDSGKINSDDNELTFYSSANSKGSLVIKLAKDTTLGSSADPLNQYFISSAIIKDYRDNGSHKDDGSRSSKNLVQMSGSGGHDDNDEHDDEHDQSQYKPVSYMQDPPTVVTPVTASDTASVPEPTILALFASALIGFGFSRRKRNQARN